MFIEGPVCVRHCWRWGGKETLVNPTSCLVGREKPEKIGYVSNTSDHNGDANSSLSSIRAASTHIHLCQVLLVMVGQWNGGPGRAGSSWLWWGQLPKPAGPSLCCLPAAFPVPPVSVLEGRPTGMYLAGCCWQLLVLPPLCVSQLAPSYTPTPVLCGLGVLPCTREGLAALRLLI